MSRSRLAPLVTVSYRSVNKIIVSGFVERWQLETNTFQMHELLQDGIFCGYKLNCRVQIHGSKHENSVRTHRSEHYCYVRICVSNHYCSVQIHRSEHEDSVWIHNSKQLKVVRNCTSEQNKNLYIQYKLV